jgi:hypothetical protein
VIVSLHVATGAAGGSVVRSRRAAVALGLALHLAGDLVPHHDIRSRRFEIGSGLAGLLLLITRHGLLAPATLGALAASAPDIEHVIRLPRPRGKKLFPSHRIAGLHREGGLPAGLQLFAAGVLLGAIASS